MTIDKEKVKELLGSGLTVEVTADALGVTQGYISQLLAEEDFKSEVIALKTKNLTANSERDKKIDSIEDGLIDQLSEAVENRAIYKPREILSAFAVVNAARRRGVPAQAAVGLQQLVVNLQLPAAVVTRFSTTAQGEVIDVTVDDRKQTLITMPSGQLLKELAGKDQEHGENYERIRKFLPGQEISVGKIRE